MRIGHGFDVHRLVKGRKLIIGGVEIEYEYGLDGHSDADVLVHAICDACLGASGNPDIGQQFPPDDEQYRGMDSLQFLKRVNNILRQGRWSVSNIDCTIIAEKPKMSPHLQVMKENIAQAMSISPSQINIKATTTEGLGYCGRGEGISAHAVVLLEQKVIR